MGNRTLWNQPGLDDPDHPSNQGDPFKPDISDTPYSDEAFLRPDRQMVGIEGLETRQLPGTPKANLLSSYTDTGMHKPVLDIDLPCELRPSKTPGHYHLLIGKEMSWYAYENLLWALVEAGIIEPNYATASEAAGMSFIRTEPEKRPERSARSDAPKRAYK